MSEKSQTEAEIKAWLLNRGKEVRQVSEARKTSKAVSAAGNDTLFLDEYEKVLAKVFKNKVPVPGTLNRSNRKPKRILNLLLSDLHYGARLDGREVPFHYGPLEEARRTAAVIVQCADYKRHYRKDTILHVHLLGDIIQNQLHDFRDGANLTEQVASAQYILAQALSFLAREFPAGVVVRCTPGNHGRNTARHKQRATNEKWDAVETMIYYGLKMAMREFPNVRFDIPRTPYYTAQTFDDVGFYTHGDTVINPGYPGKSIQADSLNNQINRLVVAKEQKFGIVAVGHVHIATMVHLSSGVVFISNGALIPTDAYAQSIGIHHTACGQWVWESVQGHPVGDSRFVTVDQNTDTQKELDAIVKPFLDFNEC